MSSRIQRINLFFRNLATVVRRYRWLILILFVVANGAALTGVKQLKKSNSAESWFLNDDPLHIAKDEFEKTFGNNDRVMILVQADNVWTQARLQSLREMGEELEEEVPLVEDLQSIADLEFTQSTEEGLDVDQLIPEEIPNDPVELLRLRKMAESKEFLVDRIFSGNGQSALIVLSFEPYPLTEEITTPDGTVITKEISDSDWHLRIYQKVKEITSAEKYKNLKITLAGIPVTNSMRSGWFGKESGRLFGINILLMFVFLGLFLRTFPGIVGTILTAFGSMIVVFGIQGWSGVEIESTMIIIPVLLVFVVAVGYSVHLLSIFKQEFRKTGKRQLSLANAMEKTGWSIFLTVVTTVAGFLSFMVVPLVPIRWVGATSAALVFVTYPLVMLFIPALLSFGKDREPVKATKTKQQKGIEGKLIALGDWILNHQRGILLLFPALLIGSVFMMTRLEVDTDVLKTTGRKVPYVDLTYRVSENIGSLYSFNLTIDLGEMNKGKEPDVLNKLNTLTKEIEAHSFVKRTTSLLDIVKDLNKTMHENQQSFYSIPDDQQLIAQLLLLYEMSGGTNSTDWVNHDYSTLRVMVELTDFSAKNIGEHMEFIDKRAKELFPGARMGMTGTVVQFAKMVNYLTAGQMKSVLIALVCVSLMLMLVFGNIRLGLIGMIPNVTPVLIATGLMALLDIPLHMMTMMIAPMVIGIAVDDTIHYISHFQDSFRESGSYQLANRETFRTVGKAIFLTSLIIVLGYLAFLSSDAKSFQHFGLITIISVAAALLADYFVTPILICRYKVLGEEKTTVLPKQQDKAA